MPVDTQQIISEAEKLGQLVAQHAAVAKYKAAQKSVADDPDAGRLLGEFNRQLEALDRQEQTGIPVTESQRTQLEQMQSKIISNIKVKALNLAQVEFIDLLRRVTQTIQRPLTDTPSADSTSGRIGQ